MRYLLKASEEKQEFYNLIGKEVTFSRDLISIGGYIVHRKGEKAFISDVEYANGLYSRMGYWIEPKINTFKINGVPAGCFRPDTFLEFKNKTNE